MFRVLAVILFIFLGLSALSVFVDEEDYSVLEKEEFTEHTEIENDAEEKVATLVIEANELEEVSDGGVSREDSTYIESSLEAVQKNTYRVLSVIDGDTVKLEINGKSETVRLIGLDTPETVHPSKPVQCFGIEASNKAKELLSNQVVQLEIDEGQGQRDKYGRMLGYVFLPDGRNYNLLMIEQGYAYEYTYSTPYRYQKEFREAQRKSRENKTGLWADGVCDDVAEEKVLGVSNVSSTGNWYVSSHHSSRFYYCEESEGWKSLSSQYLKVFSSQEELLRSFPSHTLHNTCT